MPQGTSQPGSGPMRLGSGKPQPTKGIGCLPPDTEPDSSPIQNAMPVQPVSYSLCMLPRQLLTILESHLDEEMVTAPASPE